MSEQLVYDAKTGEVLDTRHTTPTEALSRSEIESQVATAKRWPRSIDQFLKAAASLATFDEETAAGCFYSLPRGGKMVSGPSVRLAKIVASTWGHMRTETRVISEEEKYVTVQSTAWDVQQNVINRQEVRRRITNKKGERYNDDMISTTIAAASSIAYRNAVFSVVPDVYVRRLEAEARRVAVGDQKTLTQRRGIAMDYWAKAGIANDRVLATLGKKAIDDVDLDDLVTLKGLATAVKEGSISIDVAFPASVDLVSGKGFGFGNKPRNKANNQQDDHSKHATVQAPQETIQDAPPSVDEMNSLQMLLAQVADLNHAGDLIALANDLPNFTEQELAPKAREEVLAAIELRLQAIAKG